MQNYEPMYVVCHFKHTPTRVYSTPNYDPFLKSDGPHKFLFVLHIVWTWGSSVDSEHTYYQQSREVIDILYGVRTLYAEILKITNKTQWNLVKSSNKKDAQMSKMLNIS